MRVSKRVLTAGVLGLAALSGLLVARSRGRDSPPGPPAASGSVAHRSATKLADARDPATDRARFAQALATLPSPAEAAQRARVVGSRDHVLPFGSGSPSTSASIEELEQAFEIEGRDLARQAEVLERAKALLGDDPASEGLAVDCTASFCRLRIEKPFGEGLDWPAIDRALRPVARGETIFRTERAGASAIGYVYTAALHSHLPLSAPTSDEGE